MYASSSTSPEKDLEASIVTFGPTPESSEKSIINPFENIAATINDIPIKRMSDRKEVPCRSIWSRDAGGHDGPVLFILFRRFGCSLCQMTAMNFSALKPFFDAKNVKMVGVGVEEAGYDNFVERGFFMGNELYVDKKHLTYNALKTTRYGIANLFGFTGDSEIKKLFDIAAKNGYETDLRGDWSTYGGFFIIGPNGNKTLFSHLQDKTAMEPDMRKLMQSIGYTDADMPKDLYPAHNTNVVCLKRNMCMTSDYVASVDLFFPMS